MTALPNFAIQDRLQFLLNQLQLDDAPAGGAVVVYHNGNCIAQAATGLARPDLSWQADTLSLNFSAGKGILATLVHVLVSNGILEYDAPISDYWSEFDANGKAKITLREVLSHQANLFAITSLEIDASSMLDWSLMTSKVAAMSPAIPEPMPSSQTPYVSAYSALVYGWVLGGLIEAATHQPFQEVLKTYLTEPLGISESCYFGVPSAKVDIVAKLPKDFVTDDAALAPTKKRRKPVLKAESLETLATFEKLPSYPCWQELAVKNGIASEDKPLNTAQISQLYFNQSKLNLKNYKAALIPNGAGIDYYAPDALQAVMPAVNGVASAKALAIIYAMLASGGNWQGKTLIDSAAFTKLATPQVDGQDAVMPTNMAWRLGYHRLFQVCNPKGKLGFGHMGYNGASAWCDPERNLSFAFVHNFDVTMLTDIRQFALAEAVIAMVDEAL